MNREDLLLTPEEQIQAIKDADTGCLVPPPRPFMDAIIQAQVVKCREQIRQEVIEEIEENSSTCYQTYPPSDRLNRVRQIDEFWWQQFKRGE